MGFSASVEDISRILTGLVISFWEVYSSGKYHLNNLGRLDPALLFSATNYTNFTNFLFFFVLLTIRSMLKHFLEFIYYNI